MAALGLERTKGWVRVLFDALIYVAIMVPGIVIGISSLITFVTIFDVVNPTLQALFNLRLQMGMWSVIATHVLFNIAVVALLVRARLQGMDRSLVEASEDLYATPMGTFRQVVLPLLAPSILAGALLAFTFSFEDFIIAFFVAGPDVTLPIYVFSAIRRGVTPEINAVGTVVLLTSLVLLVVAQWILQRGNKKRLINQPLFALHRNSETATEDSAHRATAGQKPLAASAQGMPFTFMPKRPATSVGGRNRAVRAERI